jgi:hypothetical protein
MTIAHEFPEGDDPKRRCKWCGTTHELHDARPQACVPRRGDYGEEMRPEPERRQMAADDADVISARIAEIRRDEAVNKTEETS